MSYSSRLPVADEYIKILGRAIYNFSYLEWIIIWTVEKLSPGYLSQHKGKTAGVIADDFKNAARQSSAPETRVQEMLLKLADRFHELKNARNALLHANPYTSENGEQLLNRQSEGKNFSWSIEHVTKAASDFEQLAIEANDLFHTHLNK